MRLSFLTHGSATRDGVLGSTQAARCSRRLAPPMQRSGRDLACMEAGDEPGAVHAHGGDLARPSEDEPISAAITSAMIPGSAGSWALAG